MGSSKHELERTDEVKQATREFLLSKGLAEEALDGTLHGNVSSDNAEIYKMANQYFKEKGFDQDLHIA